MEAFASPEIPDADMVSGTCLPAPEVSLQVGSSQNTGIRMSVLNEEGAAKPGVGREKS